MAFFKRRTELTPVTASPAGGSITSRIGAGSSAVVDRATQIYRNNPKAVGGAALVASALLLNFLRRR